MDGKIKIIIATLKIITIWQGGWKFFGAYSDRQRSCAMLTWLKRNGWTGVGCGDLVVARWQGPCSHNSLWSWKKQNKYLFQTLLVWCKQIQTPSISETQHTGILSDSVKQNQKTLWESFCDNVGSIFCIKMLIWSQNLWDSEAREVKTISIDLNCLIYLPRT